MSYLNASKAEKSVGLTIFIPQNLVDLTVHVIEPGEHKQEVAQTVDKPQHHGVDIGLLGQAHDTAFTAAAHGAAYMNLRGCAYLRGG